METDKTPGREPPSDRAEWVRRQAETLGRLLRAQGIEEEAVVSRIRQHYPSPMRRRLLRFGFRAAAALLPLIGFAAYHLIQTTQLSWVSLSTAIGEVRSVTLVDGSHVKLDTDTSMRTRLSPGRRDLVLERGQAHFDVSPDWLRDFFVTVNDRVERATGTKFTVTRKNAAESETLVTEGKIEVLDKEKASTAGAKATTVAAGQLVEITPSGVRVEQITPLEVKRRLAWMEEKLEFQETLEQAVAEFNRYNERKLVIDDASLHSIPVTGRFNAHKPDLFAEGLSRSHRIDYVPIGPPGSGQGEIHLRPRVTK